MAIGHEDRDSVSVGGSFGPETFITKSHHLMWFKVEHPPEGTVKVHTHHTTITDAITLPEILTAFLAIPERSPISGKPSWTSQQSSTERIIAQIADSPTSTFVIHYYSIGVGDDYRLASYFILDAEGQRPVLPGGFDYQAPLPLTSIEEFFDLDHQPTALGTWQESNSSFKTKHAFQIVLRLREAGVEYIGLDVRSELHQYPYGRLVGGLPFGAKHIFLAICRLNDTKMWKKAFLDHKQLFIAWNLICRKGSKLTRVFIEGEPGSGKELWVDAIQHGSRPHRDSENWKKLSATLPIANLQLLLYGERSGPLERPGFLDSCAGGGVFLDEIGKSDAAFRKDLLRVLESEVFIPAGGLPTKIDNVLFVFASTPDDKTNAPDPPDFWTRMDVELLLPEPIRLKRPMPIGLRVRPFTDYDEDRFHALLSHFWFLALKEQIRGVLPNEESLLRDFRTKVFDPILRYLTKAPRDNWPISLRRVAVSPRRIRSLALTIASEYQWLAETFADNEVFRQSAEDAYQDLVRRFVDVFVRQLVQDERNVQDVRKETANRRRLGADREL